MGLQKCKRGHGVNWVGREAGLSVGEVGGRELIKHDQIYCTKFSKN